MKVSVIVPVYRVPEALLRACVDSLRRQTLTDMEILFIVDGADDPSRPVLEAEARKDPRIAVLCNERNQGVSASRNRGLEVAQGDWFGFVDADDRVDPAMYEKLLRVAQDVSCDLAGCGFRREAADGTSVLDCPVGKTWAMDSDIEAARAYGNAKTSCCSKLFNRVRFGGLRFHAELTNMEDAVFLTEALNQARRVGFLSEALYHVGHRADSAHRRRMDLDRLMRSYRAFSLLAALGAERSKGTRWMRRLWAWRLLAWSVAARRYHDELPAESHGRALEEIRRFYAVDLKTFHGMYPAWLRRMLERRMKEPARFFGHPGWFYTLLWQRIRIGLAPFEGQGGLALALDGLRRLAAKATT